MIQSTILSNGNLEIRVDRSTRIRVEIRPHPYEIEWPAFDSTREKKAIEVAIASPLEKSFRVTLTQETPRKYARAHHILLYISIFISALRAPSMHGSFAAMFN